MFPRIGVGPQNGWFIPGASKEHSFLLVVFCARSGKNCSFQKYRTFVKNVLDTVEADGEKAY